VEGFGTGAWLCDDAFGHFRKRLGELLLCVIQVSSLVNERVWQRLDFHTGLSRKESGLVVPTVHETDARCRHGPGQPKSVRRPNEGMRRKLRENGLGLVLFLLFVLTLGIGQTWTGLRESNAEASLHGKPPESLGKYLTGPHFWEATTENWESEFLQMGIYVILTVVLYQKGSSESKGLSGSEPVDRDPRKHRNRRNAPWPVKRGGWALAIYEHSLSLAFLLLFLACFLMHGVSGCANFNEELQEHGQPPLKVLSYMASSRFWFESLQNWQSEFLAIFSMVMLSIFLRERGSPESKPVDAPHGETGE
jgi:hypothetical protein